ncbi:MAG: type II toxin-antitoxin system RelE family toxin [Desulfomonilaceae bacterium]
MKYELLIETRAQKQLAKITQPYQDRIIAAIRGLAEQPKPAASKRLSGSQTWRLRVGDYRVIYEIHEESLIIIVITIGHRREVYRR